MLHEVQFAEERQPVASGLGRVGDDDERHRILCLVDLRAVRRHQTQPVRLLSNRDGRRDEIPDLIAKHAVAVEGARRDGSLGKEMT